MTEAFFNEIVKENYGKIFRICFRHFGNVDDAEDATQEIFLKTWLNRDQFRGDAKIGTWMYRIAINVCLTYIRRRKSETSAKNYIREHLTPDQEAIEIIPGDDQAGKQIFLDRFLSSLPAIDRTIINLYLENLDSRKIAEITGISDSNVRIRIHRIKIKLTSEWEAKHEK